MCAKRFPDRDIGQHDSGFQADLDVDDDQSTSGNSASVALSGGVHSLNRVSDGILAFSGEEDLQNVAIRQEYKDEAPTSDTQPPAQSPVVLFNLSENPASAKSQELQQAKSQVSDLKTRLSESKAKEQNLEKKLDKVTQEKSQTEYKLKENEVKLQENEDRFKNYSKKKESEIASLKKSINSYKEKLAKKERENKSMKESHAAEIEKLTVELAKMKSIYDETVLQLTKDKHVLELQLKDKEIEEHSLRRQIEEAKRENAELRCSQLEGELKELRRLVSQTSLSSQTSTDSGADKSG